MSKRRFYYVGTHDEPDDVLLVSENETDFYRLNGDHVRFHRDELKQVRPATPRSFERFDVPLPPDYRPVPSWPDVIRLLGYEMNSGNEISIQSLSALIQGMEWANRLDITPVRLLAMSETEIVDAAWASFRDERVKQGESIQTVAEQTDQTIKDMERVEAQHEDVFRIYPKASVELVAELETRERFLRKAHQAVAAYLEYDPRYIEKIVDRRFLEKQENARLRSDL